MIQLPAGRAAPAPPLPIATRAFHPQQLPQSAAYPLLARARIALVHDYLLEQGGAENVVEIFCRLFPDAPLYTSIFNPASVSGVFSKHDVRTSFLQRVTQRKSRAKALLALYPLAFERLDLSGYDLILSSASGFAKGIRVPGDARHVCYCHTPAHFIWDLQRYAQTRRGALGNVGARIAAPLLPALRRWDQASAARVDVFLANSTHTAGRIAEVYHRESTVLYPPIEVATWTVADAPDDYYLIVSRLLPYKRIDLAVQAFNQLGLPLRIVGDGPERRRLQQLARPNIHFEGRVPLGTLVERYARCRALIVPGIEDLGLTALEVQASGRPVIAFRGGGVCETVVEGETGVFFDAQTSTSLAEAIAITDTHAFDPARVRLHAETFDVARFSTRLLDTLEHLLAGDAAGSTSVSQERASLEVGT